MATPADPVMKLQHIIGLPVLISHTGRMAGRIKDVWFDEHWKLKGFVLDGWCWKPRTVRTVLWDEVLTCGEDCVFIRGKESVRTASVSIAQRSFLNGCVRLKDLPVVTAGGSQLGRVSDVYIDPFMGTQLVGFELTDGFVSDLMDGRRWLRAPRDSDVFLLGEDAIIVPTMDESSLERVAASDPYM
ncbi:PRC-barrel domain-containing protein [Paenibacillus sp. D51F]